MSVSHGQGYGSCIPPLSQICPGDGYQPFEPSSSTLGHSQVAPDPPWPQDGACQSAMVRVMESCIHPSPQSCPGDDYQPFEPSISPLGHSQVAPDPPWPQDGACQSAMVRVMRSCTNQSCPGDDYQPFEPSISPLGYSQVAPDPLRTQDGACQSAMVRVMGSCTTGYQPFVAAA